MIRTFACALAVLLGLGTARGETFVWRGTVDGCWTTVGNWESEGGTAATRVPGQSDAAIFGDDLTGAQATTIDLDGLDAVAYVEIRGAQNTYTFGTSSSQIFPLQVDGALCVKAGAHAPRFTATFSRGRNYAYGYWSSRPSGAPYPGLAITNDSAETLTIGAFSGTTGTNPNEMRLDLQGTGSIAFTGTTPNAPSLHPNVNLGGELVIDTSFGVREIKFQHSPRNDLHIKSNGVLFSSVASYGLFGSGFGTVNIYGEGSVRFDNVSDMIGVHDTPQYMSQIMTIGCAVTANNRSATEKAGYMIGRSGGTCEFTGSNAVEGLVEIVNGTLKTAEIGMTGVPSRIGSGGMFLMSGNGWMRYVGEGETSDKSITITNAVRSISNSESGNGTKSVATTPTAGVKQAGTGPLTMSGTAKAACADAKLLLEAEGSVPATWTGSLLDGGGTLAVTKQGAGRWTLAGTCGYSGATTVSAGTLELAPGTSIAGSGSLVMGGGTLEIAELASETAVTLPPVSVTGTGEIRVGVNVHVTIPSLMRTSGTLNVVVPVSPASVKVTGLAGGTAPAWLLVNGMPSAVDAEGVLSVKDLTSWLAPVDGDWSETAKWSAGAPGAASPVEIRANGGDYAVRITEATTYSTNALIANASGTATLAVSNQLTGTGGRISLARGGALLVGAGGACRNENLGADCKDNGVDVHDGAAFTIDGGSVTLTNYNGYVDVDGGGSRAESRLSIVNGGSLSIFPPLKTWTNVGSQIRVTNGGRLEVDGGRVDLQTGFSGSQLLVDDGEVEFRGDSKFYIWQGDYVNDKDAIVSYGARLNLGRGRHVFGGNTELHWFYTSTLDTSLYIHPDASSPVGSTSEMVLEDDVDFVNKRGGGKLLQLYIGGDGRRGVLRMHGRKNLFNGNHIAHTFIVPNGNGEGELSVTNGTIGAGAYGLWVGYASGDANATGRVSVASGKLFCNGRAAISFDWGLSRLYGTFIGDGAAVAANKTGRGHGRLEVSGTGTFENKYGHFMVGYGRSEGVVEQTGGTIEVNTCKSDSSAAAGVAIANSSTNSIFAVGAFGGTGRYVVSGGETHVQIRTFVGGVTTNEFVNQMQNGKTVSNWAGSYGYADCHDATGRLTVTDGGVFTSTRAVVLGDDGTGTLEIGGSGRLDAQTLDFRNGAASQATFTFGADGVGSVTVANLVISSGAKLVVDASAYRGNRMRFPLLTAQNVDGAFNASDVEITGLPPNVNPSCASVKQTPNGCALMIMNGTMFLLR